VFQLLGTTRPGALPWTLLGAPPQDPLYRLAFCALAMPPFCQILNTPLIHTHALQEVNAATSASL